MSTVHTLAVAALLLLGVSPTPLSAEIVVRGPIIGQHLARPIILKSFEYEKVRYDPLLIDGDIILVWFEIPTKIDAADEETEVHDQKPNRVETNCSAETLPYVLRQACNQAKGMLRSKK